MAWLRHGDNDVAIAVKPKVERRALAVSVLRIGCVQELHADSLLSLYKIYFHHTFIFVVLCSFLPVPTDLDW